MDYENKFRPAGSFDTPSANSAEEPAATPSPAAFETRAARFDPLTGAPIVPPAPSAPSASSEPDLPPKKSNSGFSAKKIVALALACSLVGGALGAGAVYLLTGKDAPQVQESASPTGNVTAVWEGQRPTTVIDIQSVDTSKLMTPAEVYAANVNSTVGITTSITTNYWGFQSTAAASGSGFILSSDGYILTNHHVIEGSNAITVALYDGTTYDAELIGYDESKDIAVLKVDAQDLTPVVLGDSNNLNVGDSVIAIGNPLGELTFSLTAGTVSAMDRQITMSSGVTMNLLQTDCAINSGNSGGALFNLYGEVIGVTNAKYSGDGSSGEASIDNIGFAIPMNDVRSIVESIIEKGYFAKPYIGVSVADVSAETQIYGLPQGAAVKEIVKDSPAEKCGLQVNDIITHVNGQAITGSQDLVDLVGNAKVGDQLALTVYRMGETIELTLEVGEKIQSATEQESYQQQQQQQYPQGFPFGY